MSDYLTLIIKLPTAPAEREKVINTLKQGAVCHGAKITAVSNGDGMSLLHMIENHRDFADHITEDARNIIDQLHATASKLTT